MDLRTIQAGGGGVGGTLARGGLTALSWGYGAGLTLWSAARAAGLLPVRRLPVPVLSVGNLVAGGTGKTPFTAWLVERLRRAGRTPGILSRGYGPRTPSGLSDEGAVLAHRLGADLPQQEDPDRLRGGRRLLAAHPAVDALVLDDGFQHRRLARDLDVVLLDAADPFGGGRLLPRGMLRESPAALARAHAVVLTRVEHATADALAHAQAAVARFTAAPVACARTVAQALEVEGARLPTAALSGQPVVALSGLGRPEAFEATLGALGARLVGRRRLRDHGALTAAGWAQVQREAASAGARWVVITRKDAVKVPQASSARAGAVPCAVLDVDLEVLRGEDDLMALVRRAVSRGAGPAA